MRFIPALEGTILGFGPPGPEDEEGLIAEDGGVSGVFKLELLGELALLSGPALVLLPGIVAFASEVVVVVVALLLLVAVVLLLLAVFRLVPLLLE